MVCASSQVEAQVEARSDTRSETPVPTIARVELVGASDPAVARYLTLKAGEPNDPEAIRSSVLLLSAMDQFDEIVVEQEAEADGRIRLVFKVLETPRLGELVFVTPSADTGSDVPLKSSLGKELARASGLRNRDLFRDRALVDASARMTDWLRQHAYPRATVELEPLADYARLRSPGFLRDIRVRVLQPKEERLVSSRIDGWPGSLPLPKSPARLGAALTVETIDQWTNSLSRLLWKNGHYRAQAKAVSVEGDLVFFVTPGPRFSLILDVLTEADRAKARERFEAEGLSQDTIEETMSAIEADYVKRGHRDVDVDFQELPGATTTGEFVIRLGPVWTLSGVDYQTNGVASPTPDDSSLKPGGPWIDADIEAEKSRLRAQLLQAGHAGALVSHEESGEPGAARVTFKVVPGSLSAIGSVTLAGAPPPADRSEAAAIELLTRENAPFRNAAVARDRNALLASLRDDGYVDARVEVTADFSDDRGSVEVVFQVTPGPRVRVGRILVVGLEDTRPVVVLRESRLKEGDLLSYQRLLDTQTALSATGLFTNVQIREIPSEEDRRNILIQLTEAPRITIVPGVGWAEVERWRASVEFTRLNISGLGRSASLFLRSSLRGSRALLSLTEPYAFRRRQAVNVRLYAEDDRSRDAFDFHRLGFQTQTVFPRGSANILAQYTFQTTTTSDVETDCAEVNRDLCDGRISGPSLGFVYDTRSDALNPRRGTFVSLDSLLSTSALGGDSFLKGSALVSRYEEIRAGTVIAASARLGLARAFGDSVDLPLPERFFAGGASLMRAFRTDEVGPGRALPENRFVPSGGNALIAMAIEARVDVTRAFGFHVFAEMGNVFPTVSAIKPKEMREVAGVGLRYHSPFGPLRLDWGFKLDRRPGEGLFQLHLGVGYAF